MIKLKAFLILCWGISYLFALILGRINGDNIILKKISNWIENIVSIMFVVFILLIIYICFIELFGS